MKQSFVPSLLLFYVFIAPRVESWTSYRETFGNPDHYLSLEYPHPPHHWKFSQNVRRIPFHGYFATSAGEYKISGTRVETQNGRVHYAFSLPDGQFLGHLDKPRQGCGWKLKYHIESGIAITALGTLNAGFCS